MVNLLICKALLRPVRRFFDICTRAISAERRASLYKRLGATNKRGKLSNRFAVLTAVFRAARTNFVEIPPPVPSAAKPTLALALLNPA